MMKLRASKAAFTTVELLVVLAIIGFISAISIPLLYQMGIFGGRKVELAARDLFTLMTAARTYATTNNIETAVAYAGGTRFDSFVEFNPPIPIPIIDSVAVVRRVRRVDFEAADPGFQQLAACMGLEWVLRNPIFVPVRAEEGNFRRFEGDTCILSDIFALNGSRSARGLTGILIWDLDCDTSFTTSCDQCFVTPRADYSVDSLTVLQSFPAHRFRSNGEVIFDGSRQRAVLRIGLLPDMDIDDRYFEIPNAGNIGIDTIVRFNGPSLTYRTFRPVDPVLDKDQVDVDVEIEIFLATGRIKVKS